MSEISHLFDGSGDSPLHGEAGEASTPPMNDLRGLFDRMRNRDAQEQERLAQANAFVEETIEGWFGPEAAKSPLKFNEVEPEVIAAKLQCASQLAAVFMAHAALRSSDPLETVETTLAAFKSIVSTYLHNHVHGLLDELQRVTPAYQGRIAGVPVAD